jgi:hypothetical protein
MAGMSASHATVGIGATSAMAALTTLLNGFHGIDSDHASAAAWLLITGGGAIYAGIQWWISWKYPTAPALPGELVDIPPGAPPAVVAVVPQPAPVPPAPEVAPHLAGLGAPGFGGAGLGEAALAPPPAYQPLPAHE